MEARAAEDGHACSTAEATTIYLLSMLRETSFDWMFFAFARADRDTRRLLIRLAQRTETTLLNTRNRRATGEMLDALYSLA
jgi:hypothetical protein